MWDRGKANESARHEIGAVDQPATDSKDRDLKKNCFQAKFDYVEWEVIPG